MAAGWVLIEYKSITNTWGQKTVIKYDQQTWM